MDRETRVQSQVESYQRLKKWYLIHPCLTLSIIRSGSRVKWSNPGKGVAPSPTPRFSSYRKGSLQVILDYSCQLYLLYLFKKQNGGKKEKMNMNKLFMRMNLISIYRVICQIYFLIYSHIYIYIYICIYIITFPNTENLANNKPELLFTTLL